MSNKRQMRWNEKADQMLSEYLNGLKNPKWPKISKMMREKGLEYSPKQCRVRWLNVLDPNIAQEKWSLQEEMTLFEQWLSNGSRWCLISKSLPGRTENGVKNRFYSTIRRILRKYRKNFPNSIDFDMPVKDIVEDQEKVRKLLSFSTDGIYSKDRYSDRANITASYKPIKDNTSVETDNFVFVSMEKFYETSGIYEVVKLPLLNEKQFDCFQHISMHYSYINSNCFLSEELDSFYDETRFSDDLETSDNTPTPGLISMDFSVEEM